jgi:hypothetical protein
MSRNGSGGYSLPVNSWNPAVNGVSATAADWQSLINDVATALQQSVSADGQTPITGNLAMGGNKLTGLGAGVGTGESLRFEQLFSQGTLTSIASATTTDIGAQLSNFLQVTGTTTITSFGTNYNGPRFLIFSGALLLTHSATLVLPGAANITTVANDCAIAIPISGGWQVVAYQRASGFPVVTTGFALSGANTDIASLGGLTSPVTEIRQIQPISASVAANALTISASALALQFRSSTLGSGAVSFVKGTPANLVISSGSTLGTTSAVQSRIAVLALNNAGTIELAAANAAGVDLSETGLISTTAEGGAGAADSGTVAYSTTARTNVAYRVIGYIESTQATAGTWATAPSTIQGAGGQALIQSQGLVAWAVFNGTTAGTNAPTAGRGVTSVTRNAAGDYTINLSTSMPDANYAFVGHALDTTDRSLILGSNSTGTSPTNKAFRFQTFGTSVVVLVDVPRISVAFFR